MSGIRILYWNVAESRANIDKALYYTEEYDILVVQKVAVDRETGRAYCPALSRYTVVYSSGRAAIYVYKRWNIKTPEAAEGDNWARITIGEKIAAIIVWSIYSPIQIRGFWNISFNIIEPGNALILVGDFNIYHPLWDIHGRTSRNSSEIAAYILRWNMELYIPFGEIIRRKYGQRTFIINLAWATIGLLIRYYGNIGLEESDHKAQFISIYIVPGIMELYTPKVEGWN
jgi:hypothetical protein